MTTLPPSMTVLAAHLATITPDLARENVLNREALIRNLLLEACQGMAPEDHARTINEAVGVLKGCSSILEATGYPETAKTINRHANRLSDILP